jgi:hypothetical protein
LETTVKKHCLVKYHFTVPLFLRLNDFTDFCKTSVPNDYLSAKFLPCAEAGVYILESTSPRGEYQPTSFRGINMKKGREKEGKH